MFFSIIFEDYVQSVWRCVSNGSTCYNRVFVTTDYPMERVQFLLKALLICGQVGEQ